MMTCTNLPALVRGVAEVESTERGLRLHRLPAWVRRQFQDGQLLAMESQPSGARLVLRTEATAIDLVTHPTRVGYRGVTRPRGCVDVYLDGVQKLAALGVTWVQVHVPGDGVARCR